jgi:Leucine-rich repeat (LRR) protein
VEDQQAKLFEGLFAGTTGDKVGGTSTKYEDRVQRTGFQGYLLIVNSMTDGKLDTLPKEICAISYLNELNISNNSLKYVPSDIARMKDLKRLHLDNNQLTSLPQEIATLQNLKVLNIKGNKIPKEEVDKLQKLMPRCKIKS